MKVACIAGAVILGSTLFCAAAVWCDGRVEAAEKADKSMARIIHRRVEAYTPMQPDTVGYACQTGTVNDPLHAIQVVYLCATSRALDQVLDELE